MARTLNLIAGDGQTNVLHLNTLDYERWESDYVQRPGWLETYSTGWFKLQKLRADKKSYRDFTFDIVMANPPLQATSRKVVLYQSMILEETWLWKN